MMRRALALLLLQPVCYAAPAGLPCTNWPVSMAEVNLQNAGIFKIYELDESRTKAIPLALEKIGKNLYRQVFDITLYHRDGRKWNVITVNEASPIECSMSGVDVYLIDKKFSADSP